MRAQLLQHHLHDLGPSQALAQGLSSGPQPQNPLPGQVSPLLPSTPYQSSWVAHISFQVLFSSWMLTQKELMEALVLAKEHG